VARFEGVKSRSPRRTLAVMRAPEALRDLEEPTIGGRPIGVFVVAALSALAGTALLVGAVQLFLGATRYADWSKPQLVGNDFVGAVQVYPEHYLLVGAFLLVPAGYLVALAYGIVRGRFWAWVLGVVAGGLLVAYGILALVIPAEGSHDESVIVTERWHPAAGLPWIVVGGALIWYLQRRVVKHHLEMGDPAIG
jgi:hypothetical protein